MHEEEEEENKQSKVEETLYNGVLHIALILFILMWVGQCIESRKDRIRHQTQIRGLRWQLDSLRQIASNNESLLNQWQDAAAESIRTGRPITGIMEELNTGIKTDTGINRRADIP